MAKPRLLLSAAYSTIEPLGLMHLAGLARDLGHDRLISLIPDHDDTRLLDDIRSFRPDFVGINVYTGNHVQVFNTLRRIKQRHPNIVTILGGPHPTYFPSMAASHADYVVMSEGFRALKGILDGSLAPGIHPYSTSLPFPQPDRATLYEAYPEYAASPIKSMIGMTGCPYRCTYCYNSSAPEDIQCTPEVAEAIAGAMGSAGRLFPFNQRSVDELIAEGEELNERWPTEVIAFVDDIHGFDTKRWLPEMVDKWPRRVGIGYSGQMRWEMVNGPGGEERLDLVSSAGGFSLTLAIEAANDHLRKEVLDRATPESLMHDGMANIRERGFKVRTEQITALPYGATTHPSPVNLEADLQLVELNNRLKPDIAWASTYAPYVGTKLGSYASKHGHYDEPHNFDVPDSFFDRSVLRFPQNWVGPSLRKESVQWLSEDELELYRDQNAALRSHFNLLSMIPRGHVLARQWLSAGKPFTSEGLTGRIKHHLYDEVLYRRESALKPADPVVSF